MKYQLCCSIYESLKDHDEKCTYYQILGLKDTTLIHTTEADDLYDAIVRFCELCDDEIKQLCTQNNLYFYQLKNGSIQRIG